MDSGGEMMRDIVYSSPAFSNDSKKLLVCTGNIVSVFSTLTGSKITELQGHEDQVSSIIVIPASTTARSTSDSYCWTASFDGTIKYWDFSIPKLMRTISVKRPVISMVIPSLLNMQSENNDVFAYISVKATKKNTARIQKCNPSTSALVPEVILSHVKNLPQITISPSGKYLGIHKERKVLVWKVPTKDSMNTSNRKLELCHTEELSCIAFHPKDMIIAAADVTGSILVWRGYGDKTFAESYLDNEKPSDSDFNSCTILQSDYSEVRVLVFSSDGAYLYSGGERAPMLWNLDTGVHRFLPEPGVLLLSFIFSPDSYFSSMFCADNTIKILRMPEMEFVTTIYMIKPPELLFDRAGLVAVRTQNCVKFQNLFEDRKILEVSLCAPSDSVTVAALSFKGSLMCTAETTKEETRCFDRLKFWQRGSPDQEFKMFSSIDRPHSDAVTVIALHPTREMAVSASTRGDFKVWHIIDKKWECCCTAPSKYRWADVTAAAFTSNSVLAIAQGNRILLHELEKNGDVLSIIRTAAEIGNLSFSKDSEFLVSTSKGESPRVSVWSMSMKEVCWSYKLNTEAIACSGPHMAVLVHLCQYRSMGAILFFKYDYDHDDPSPVASWLVSKPKGGGLAFIQTPDHYKAQGFNDAVLAYVNGIQEYAIFDPLRQEDEFIKTNPPLAGRALKPLTTFPRREPWDIIFGGWPPLGLLKDSKANAGNWLSSQFWRAKNS